MQGRFLGWGRQHEAAQSWGGGGAGEGSVVRSVGVTGRDYIKLLLIFVAHERDRWRIRTSPMRGVLYYGSPPETHE